MDVSFWGRGSGSGSAPFPSFGRSQPLPQFPALSRELPCSPPQPSGVGGPHPRVLLRGGVGEGAVRSPCRAFWGLPSPRQNTLFFLSLDFHAVFDIICDHVGKDWKRLARQLKLTDSRIDAIEVKYPRNLTEQVRESLRVWRRAARGHAEVSHLVQALRACRLNLVADLVQEEQQAQSLRSESGGSTVSLTA